MTEKEYEMGHHCYYYELKIGHADNLSDEDLIKIAMFLNHFSKGKTYNLPASFSKEDENYNFPARGKLFDEQLKLRPHVAVTLKLMGLNL